MADPRFVADHGRAVAEAVQRIEGRALKTPCLWPPGMPGVAVKAECLQPTGSFKLRGAFNALLSLSERGPRPPGVVTVSSGNHGQAVAYAARALGLPAVVVMPAEAAPSKRDAVVALGARVVSSGVTTVTREERFRQVVEETGYVPVHPYDDWSVIYGQGTVGMEISDQVPEAATVVVPVGGGGLISGIAIALAWRTSAARVVGVEPVEADDARRSLDARRIVSRPPGPSLADGALVTRVGDRPAEVLLDQRLVHAVVTVTDDELLGAMARIARETHLVAEPTGALALAAVLVGRVPAGTGPTVAVLSGGNVEAGLLASALQAAAPAGTGL